VAPGQPHRFSSRLTRAFSVNEFFFLAMVSQRRKSYKKKNSAESFSFGG